MRIWGGKTLAILLSFPGITSCNTTLSAEPGKTAEKEIAFPSEIEGVLDEGWEVYVMHYDSCLAQQKDYCEVFERAKRDTYISQLWSREL